MIHEIKSLPHHLLITFANSLELDQARQNVGPDQDPNCFDTLMVFLKEFLKKVDFEKISRRQKALKITSNKLSYYNRLMP